MRIQRKWTGFGSVGQVFSTLLTRTNEWFGDGLEVFVLLLSSAESPMTYVYKKGPAGTGC